MYAAAGQSGAAATSEELADHRNSPRKDKQVRVTVHKDGEAPEPPGKELGEM